MIAQKKKRNGRPKEIYYIVTMADEEISSAETTLACFRGYAACVEDAVEKGIIIGSGVYEPGEIANTKAIKKPISWVNRYNG